jgi:hypothetical protein
MPDPEPSTHHSDGWTIRCPDPKTAPKGVSIGLAIIHTQVVALRSRRPSSLLGEGRVEAIRRAVAGLSIRLVVVVSLVAREPRGSQAAVRLS